MLFFVDVSSIAPILFHLSKHNGTLIHILTLICISQCNNSLVKIGDPLPLIKYL
jgi:hypothetical protein